MCERFGGYPDPGSLFQQHPWTVKRIEVVLAADSAVQKEKQAKQAAEDEVKGRTGRKRVGRRRG